MSSKSNIQYDRIADCYKEFERHNPRKHIIIGRLFKTTVSNLEGKSVLDLGCGMGFFATLAKKLRAKYVLGVDVSRKMIELAEAETKKLGLVIDYKVCDIVDLQLNKSFDVATAGFVFNYASDKSTLRKYFLAASEHLKHGGVLFAILCNPDNPLRDTKILYRVLPAVKGKFGDGAELRCEFYDAEGKFLCYDNKFLWTRQTVMNMLKQQGFRSIKWLNIQNTRKDSKIPRLPSTNIILYATKV